ncbi:putative fatty acyl-CoA reductase CG5065 [Oppia nitens]|uniref:putative fatty acyl-CoA reductase CG5065 n=1 Tax=Oppia nitens TaxID=1686743 RepID=UPI0023DB3167|nr:putative fatty acyl-CoA reductase CG5065 [Oppia nitens]
MSSIINNNDVSQIASFYRDRSIFITGATGFMGKVLVEKLLRSCSDVKHIYILLRSKKGLNPRTRLEELLNTKIFDKLRNENPKALNKVVAITGDITLDGLGISDSDLKLLLNDVSVVFHSAATVKFDEPLKTSIEFNVLGTRRLIALCHKMPNLVALIHVSTAYANCNRSEIEELVYEAPVEPQNVIDIVNWMDEDVVNTITPKLIGDRPNTYTFTKALAESLLLDECGSLPVAIVRPSIVTASWKEPMSGWVDNLNGPTGLITAAGKGILRSMNYNSKATADIVPVDIVINLMIAIVWFTATQRPNGVLVYNCTSGSLNKFIWGQLNGFISYLFEYPSGQLYRYPSLHLKESQFMNKMCELFDHIIPAHLFDGLMALFGRKRIMVRIYERLHRSVRALEWFTTHEWNFTNNNILMLIDQLKGIDRQIFHFDVRAVNWSTYWGDYVLGTRQYILKEDNSTLPEARHNLNKLYYLNKLFGVLFLLCLWQTFSFGIPFISRKLF